MAEGDYFSKNFRTWFSVSSDNDIFSMALNTAYKFETDPIKLMARLHGQCEIYCYIQSNNLSWLASIINTGIRQKLYRANAGWEELLSFCKVYLGKSFTVCSYSVTDQFPNQNIANMSDDYYDLSDRDKWSICSDELRKNELLELKPENFAEYYFEDGKTVLDILL